MPLDRPVQQVAADLRDRQAFLDRLAHRVRKDIRVTLAPPDLRDLLARDLRVRQAQQERRAQRV